MTTDLKTLRELALEHADKLSADSTIQWRLKMSPGAVIELLDEIEQHRDVERRTLDVLEDAKIDPTDGDDNERWVDQRVKSLAQDEPLCRGCAGTYNDHLGPDRGGCPGAFPDWYMKLRVELAQVKRANAKWQDHFTKTPGLAAANAEIVALKHQIEAMTKARDEACDLAKAAIGQIECGSDEGMASNIYSAEQQLAELRKVGTK